MAGFLLPIPRPQFFTSVGVPASGYKLFFYLTNTTVKTNTYSDALLTVPNTNPVILSSAGWANTGIYLDPASSYKVVYAPSTDTDPPTSPIWTQDPVALSVSATPPQLREYQRARTTIVGTQNNYNADALATGAQTEISWLEWNGASACTLTGFSDGYDGRERVIENITAAQILTVSFQAGTSSAANRFTTNTGLTVTLSPGQRCQCLYDGADAATGPWHVLVWASPFQRAGGSVTQTIAPSGPIVQSVTTVGSVGAAETTLNTFSISANVLAVGGERLTGYFVGTTAVNGNNKRLKFKFGATTVLDTGAGSAPNGQNWRLDFTIARTGATTQKVSAVLSVGANGTFATANGTMANGTAAETLSGAVTLSMTGQGTSDNDIVNTEAAVWWHEAP